MTKFKLTYTVHKNTDHIYPGTT